MGHILELKVQAQRPMHNLRDKLLRMLWCSKLLVEELQHKLTRAVDQYLLTGMIGMIRNISKNKDKHSSISKRNKKNLREPSHQRRRRRSPRKRRRDPQVEMFSMLMLMMVPQWTKTLNSVLFQNLTWTKNKTVTITKKQRFRKTWATPELNKIEVSLMLQAWTRMINHIIWKIRRVEISIING